MKGNFGFASELLDTLKKHGNKAPIMLSSSIQATLAGRFGNSEYGRSKQAGEELFFQYGKENGVNVAVYRFPNLMGHSRPKYNSAVSTFCWAVANDEEFTVNDRNEIEVRQMDIICQLLRRTNAVGIIYDYLLDILRKEDSSFKELPMQSPLPGRVMAFIKKKSINEDEAWGVFLKKFKVALTKQRT